MEWKKIITAIAALMLAYSLVGCVSNSASTTTSEAKEVAPVGTEIKANKVWIFLQLHGRRWALWQSWNFNR